MAQDEAQRNPGNAISLPSPPRRAGRNRCEISESATVLGSVIRDPKRCNELLCLLSTAAAVKSNTK